MKENEFWVIGSLDPGDLDPGSWTRIFGPPASWSPEFWTRGELAPGVLAPGGLDPSMTKNLPFFQFPKKGPMNAIHIELLLHQFFVDISMLQNEGI